MKFGELMNKDYMYINGYQSAVNRFGDELECIIRREYDFHEWLKKLIIKEEIEPILKNINCEIDTYGTYVENPKELTDKKLEIELKSAKIMYTEGFCSGTEEIFKRMTVLFYSPKMQKQYGISKSIIYTILSRLRRMRLKYINDSENYFYGKY